MIIHVCSLARLADTVSRARARRVISLLAEGTAFERPELILEDHHLMISMHDITEELDGMTPPGRHHVETLIEFARGWDRADPMVIHCFAGISRSTAAAYIVCSALSPERDPVELAQTLRRLSPSATPNIRMVMLADEVLGRGGRMTEAVRAIGRGEDAFEGVPFELSLRAG